MGDHRVLIFGKNSRIGRYYCEHCRQKGADIVALGSQDCDLLNPESVEACFRRLPRNRYVVVFLVVINKTVDNTYRGFVGNTTMVNNFLKSSSRLEIASLTYFSSVDVYGIRPEIPITEDSRVAPDTYYGLAKMACEWMLRRPGSFKCPISILRIPGVFGWKQDTESVIGGFLKKIRAGERICLTNNGKTRRDFLPISFLAAILDRLIEHPHDGLLNVATGQSLAMSDLLGILGNNLKRKTAVEVRGDVTERDFDLIFDVTRLRAVFPELPPEPLMNALTAIRQEN